MSHIVEEKTSIENPDRALLRQACEIVAQQHDGEVTDYHLDWYRNRCTTNTGLALILPQMFRGIGLKVDEHTGALSFIGDSWGVKPLYEQVQQEITQTYIALATMQALQEMGYSVQATDDTTQQNLLILQGVSYA